jgi:hypothetical protein
MTPDIGVYLSVMTQCSQGRRKYIENSLSIRYKQGENEEDNEYGFIGIFDGQWGQEATTFSKEDLIECIINQKGVLV